MSALTLNKLEREFIERRGIMAEEDGQPRILGRIFGLLMLMERPITAAHIAELLDVSRGSVSTNLKLLDQLDVVEKTTVAGERKLMYSIGDQPYSSFVDNIIKRMAENRRMVEASINEIDRPIAKQRLKNLAMFYRVAEDCNRSMLEQLRDESLA